ncbi:MAG: AAA family ATPase [Defluviitaleaceae bacterium]|nr:AAA family ATPase [Defluviitaleaceae bacterium]
MTYINNITFPTSNMESDFICGITGTSYDTFYPFRVLSARDRGLQKIDFEPITILYGSNGSGKSTALNIIAETLEIKRESAFNKSNFYQDYIDMCKVEMRGRLPQNSRIITSDDVFDYLLNVRSLNEGIDLKREEVFKDYLDTKHTKLQMQSLEDYEQLSKIVRTRSQTRSQYVQRELMGNIAISSNGESAFKYFTDRIGENSLYILDEPENSLSPKYQMELAQFIEDSARFYECQIIMATHSPFMLAIRSAKIYDLDESPVKVKNWTELENICLYYEFFKRMEL